MGLDIHRKQKSSAPLEALLWKIVVVLSEVHLVNIKRFYDGEEVVSLLQDQLRELMMAQV